MPLAHLSVRPLPAITASPPHFQAPSLTATQQGARCARGPKNTGTEPSSGAVGGLTTGPIRPPPSPIPGSRRLPASSQDVYSPCSVLGTGMERGGPRARALGPRARLRSARCWPRSAWCPRVLQGVAGMCTRASPDCPAARRAALCALGKRSTPPQRSFLAPVAPRPLTGRRGLACARSRMRRPAHTRDGSAAAVEFVFATATTVSNNRDDDVTGTHRIDPLGNLGLYP